MILSGADILVETLIEQGADVVFGYPGGQIINVYDSLYKYKDKIHHVLSAHEQGAAHAADGYARSTGKTGVVIATSGPGATNLVTGIATAYLDSVPLVAITGNVPSNSIGLDCFQELDITGVTLPITKHNYFVSSVEDLADTIREAFQLAGSGRPGPVLIDVPKDVQVAKCEFTPKSRVELDERKAAKDVRIDEAVAIIREAKRPCIYFGGGLVTSGAQEELLELAERIDAPICCSFMGLSAVPTDHPRFLGMQGMHGHYASSMAMHHADVIVALGARFNDRVTGNRAKFAVHTKIIHIDIDGAELSKTVNVAAGLRGDVRMTLQKMLPKLEKQSHPDWTAEVDGYRQEEKEQADKRTDLNPHTAMAVVNEFLGPKTPVATDVGQHQMWAAQDIRFHSPRTFISSGGLGTMGFGLGAAIGAAYGSGERTVLITGDGSFGMCLNEMATAVTYQVPVVILLMNNGVLGMVRQWQNLFFQKHYSETVLDRATDFPALARAFGADGESVTTVEGLRAAMRKAFSVNGPYLINCAIDKDEFVLPMLPPGGSMDNIITKVGD